LKKCGNILLAFLLFVNSGGFVIVFYSQQLSVKDEIFTSISKSGYAPSEIDYFTIRKDVLYIDGNGFMWNDKKEFEYNGRMYDVIRTVENDTDCVLYCLNDLAEEKLLKSFAGEFNRLVTDDPKDVRVRTILSNLISQALINTEFEVLPSINGQKYNQPGSKSIIRPYIEIPSPPPKYC
jgi:hypothetical protein